MNHSDLPICASDMAKNVGLQRTVPPAPDGWQPAMTKEALLFIMHPRGTCITPNAHPNPLFLDSWLGNLTPLNSSHFDSRNPLLYSSVLFFSFLFFLMTKSFPPLAS